MKVRSKDFLAVGAQYIVPRIPPTVFARTAYQFILFIPSPAAWWERVKGEGVASPWQSPLRGAVRARRAVPW